MSTDSEDSKSNSDEFVAPSQATPGEETQNSQSEASTSEVVAPAAPPTAEPSPAFVRLKSHCDSHGLKSSIENDDGFEYVSIEFKNGRDSRTILVPMEEDAEALLSHPLGEIVFLGGYSAICSYREGWIEAAVRSHGVGVRTLFRRTILGAAQGEEAEVEICSPGGVTLRLTEKRSLLALLDTAQLYLRIEGNVLTEHDKVLTLLEDLSNAFFMQIDFRFDYPLTLVRDRQSSRRLSASRGPLDEDRQLVYPRYSYEASPSSLYWYARSATAMPLLQFLAFYQCIDLAREKRIP